MMVVVGVDGGGTKTDVCVATSDGRVGAFVSGPGANWEHVGLEAVRAVVGAAVTEGLELAGLRPADVRAWACCLAGVDWPRDIDRVDDALDAVLPVAPAVTNDAFASLRAGTPDGIGLVSVAGTGGVTAGRHPNGRTARTMGSTFGEGAGATGITRRALDAVARYHHGQAEDGEALAGALCAALDCADVLDLFERILRDRLPVGAAQAPVVLRLADAGDPLARSVVADAARQHGADVVGIATQLGMRDDPVLVVAAGGVHAGAGPVFSRPFADVVTGALEQATIHLLSAPPSAGAALLALDRLGPVSPEVSSRLLGDAFAARSRSISSAGRVGVAGSG